MGNWFFFRLELINQLFRMDFSLFLTEREWEDVRDGRTLFFCLTAGNNNRNDD
jgi:hypothetical protein